MEEEQSLTWETASPPPRSNNELPRLPSRPETEVAVSQFTPWLNLSIMQTSSSLPPFFLCLNWRLMSVPGKQTHWIPCLLLMCTLITSFSASPLPIPLIDRSIHQDRGPRLSWWGPDLLRLLPGSAYRENKARMTFWKAIFRRPERALRI